MAVAAEESEEEEARAVLSIEYAALESIEGVGWIKVRRRTKTKVSICISQRKYWPPTAGLVVLLRRSMVALALRYHHAVSRPQRGNR